MLTEVKVPPFFGTLRFIKLAKIRGGQKVTRKKGGSQKSESLKTHHTPGKHTRVFSMDAFGTPVGRATAKLRLVVIKGHPHKWVFPGLKSLRGRD